MANLAQNTLALVPMLGAAEVSVHNAAQVVAPSTPVVEICNPLEDPHWDETVSALPGHCIFHSRAWAAVLSQAYGYRPLYLRTKDGNKISILPLMEVDSCLTGRRGVSLPFTDHCSIPRNPERDTKSLFEKALEIGRARRWRYLELRGTQPPHPEAMPSIRYHGHKLDLTPGETRLFEAMDSATRRAVRKAEKSGVTVEFSSSLGALQAYYKLHSQTRRKHGLPPQPWFFFQAIYDRILSKELGKVALARVQGEPVAGAVFFQFGDGALFKYGASQERHQHLRTNNLVMWKAIQLFAHQGLAWLDFGRTSDYNHGLRRFKAGFGPEECPIDYYRVDCRNGRFVKTHDEPISWYNVAFKLLPRPLAHTIGRLLYKHLG